MWRISFHHFLTQISGINWRHLFPFAMGHLSGACFSFHIDSFLTSVLWTHPAVFWEWVANCARRKQPGTFTGSAAENSIEDSKEWSHTLLSCAETPEPHVLQKRIKIQQTYCTQQTCHQEIMKWWSLVSIFLLYRNNQIKFRVLC